jgi:hypothetical protein
MKERLTVFNAFFHDVATGTWLSTLVLLSLLHREARSAAWAGAAKLVPPLEAKFLWLTWISLGAIIATGVIRVLTWKLFGWTGDVEASRIRLLKVKHALLGVAFIAGTAWQAWLVYGP